MDQKRKKMEREGEWEESRWFLGGVEGGESVVRRKEYIF